MPAANEAVTTAFDAAAAVAILKESADLDHQLGIVRGIFKKVFGKSCGRRTVPEMIRALTALGIQVEDQVRLRDALKREVERLEKSCTDQKRRFVELDTDCERLEVKRRALVHAVASAASNIRHSAQTHTADHHKEMSTPVQRMFS
jgi:hypothetical protein